MVPPRFPSRAVCIKAAVSMLSPTSSFNSYSSSSNSSINNSLRKHKTVLSPYTTAV